MHKLKIVQFFPVKFVKYMYSIMCDVCGYRFYCSLTDTLYKFLERKLELNSLRYELFNIHGIHAMYMIINVSFILKCLV